MSGTTLAGQYNSTVLLHSAPQNPVTVTGTISVASGDALQGSAPIAWTITNDGSISGSSHGISLAAAGTISNGAGRTIASGAYTVYVAGAGYISNAGLIADSDSSVGRGVQIVGAGTISNAQTGTIQAAGHVGLYLVGSASVSNAGTITDTNANAIAVYLKAGGTISNAATGTIHSGYRAIYAAGTSVVTNAGHIVVGSSNQPLAMAVQLKAGGTVSNVSGGTIESGGYAISAGGVASVVNAGQITASGTSNDAIRLSAGGSVSNAATAVIQAVFYGIDVYGGAGNVANAGRITDSGAFVSAIDLHAGGTVNNAASSTIMAAYHAIYTQGGGTVTNAGTIGVTGANMIAIDLHGGAANRLVVDPGAVFEGVVDGGNAVGSAVTSTLELAAGSGTLDGIGSLVTHFGAIALDSGAQWQLDGSVAGLAAGQTISGFTTGDTLVLTGVTLTEVGLAGGVLTLSGGTTLDLPGATYARVSDVGTNTVITACFAAGTSVLTATGPRAVETLREGDLVLTARGRLAPVRWLGHRRTALRHHPRPHDVMPVRVRAGTFGEALPARDLVLSPDHAVFLDGRLVPIRYLINGVSIVQETREAIVYWHLELDRHDVILAEGMACETYLDTGNRAAFENAEGPTALHPDFARGVWAAAGCAPISADPADPTLRALHTRLLARAYSSPGSAACAAWAARRTAALAAP